MRQLETETPKVITFDFIFSTDTTNISREEILQLNVDIDDSNSNKEKLTTYDQFVTTYTDSLHPIDLAMADQLAKFDNLILGAEVFGGRVDGDDAKQVR